MLFMHNYVQFVFDNAIMDCNVITQNIASEEPSVPLHSVASLIHRRLGRASLLLSAWISNFQVTVQCKIMAKSHSQTL